MSWSVNIVGPAEKVVEELLAHRESLDGQSLKEYESALPHLCGIVAQNYAKKSAVESGYASPVVRVTASGSGVARDGEVIYSTCSVNVENYYGKVVT